MAVQTLERTALTRLNRILPTGEDRVAREATLPLRTELFLIAHDDDTGRCHVSANRLALALSSAVVLDLALAGRIRIGWRPDARGGLWTANPGRITVLSREPIGDPLADSALVAIWNAGGTPKVYDVVTRLAATGIYDRVRADMIAGGVVKRASRRRFRFSRRERYVPTSREYPVRARARIRRLLERSEHDAHLREDRQPLALAALVTKLGLCRRLYGPDGPGYNLNDWLSRIVDAHLDRNLREVAAIAAGK